MSEIIDELVNSKLHIFIFIQLINTVGFILRTKSVISCKITHLIIVRWQFCDKSTQHNL